MDVYATVIQIPFENIPVSVPFIKEGKYTITPDRFKLFIASKKATGIAVLIPTAEGSLTVNPDGIGYLTYPNLQIDIASYIEHDVASYQPVVFCLAGLNVSTLTEST